MKMDRLYVVVRADLEPGAQLAQSCHALSAFAHQYRAQHDAWQVGEQNLVVLSVPNENALGELLRAALTLGLRSSAFHEPDFGNELTAVAFEGSVARLVSSLPLALRAPRAA
jgi:peptidyl-tRNA hydrolase